jgi:hypothetical protein
VAPHNLARLTVHRTLANVLGELRDARSDWEQAIADMKNRKQWFDADDRANEAEQRTESLLLEFDQLLLSATGLTAEQIIKAREGCLL